MVAEGIDAVGLGLESVDCVDEEWVGGGELGGEWEGRENIESRERRRIRRRYVGFAFGGLRLVGPVVDMLWGEDGQVAYNEQGYLG